MGQNYDALQTRLFFDPQSSSHGAQAQSSMGVYVCGGIVVLAFTMLFFGGLGTAFRYRGQHLSLRQQHDALRLRYDSLYAAKLQTDRQLNELRKEIQLLQYKSQEKP